MIFLLRAGAFLINVAIIAGGARWAGAPWWGAATIAVLFFALCAYLLRRAPAGTTASAEILADAVGAAERLGAQAPRSVRVVPGWTAAAFATGRGYGLILGPEVAPSHRLGLVAHEIAHHVAGDLRWEPLTDGPARLLLPWVRRVPPLGVLVFPFFLLGAPLARLTEFEADRIATSAVSSYPFVLQEFAAELDRPASVLYPTLRDRAAAAARHSIVQQVTES